MLELSLQDQQKKLFSELIYHLQNIQKPVVFIPNQGNAGDILITYATLLLFKALNIPYTFGQDDALFENKTLIYGGGGNLVGTYINCKRFLENNAERNTITLLPATIYNEDTLISKLKNNVTIFCREHISFTYVKKYFSVPENIFLTPDMSFLIHKTNNSTYKKRTGEAFLFRRDTERTFHPDSLSPQNYDISVELMHNITFLDEDGIEKIALSLLEYVSQFEHVKTDRLHVAIACHLTQTPCDFYPNSYYKNKAVYDFILHTDSYIKFIN